MKTLIRMQASQPLIVSMSKPSLGRKKRYHVKVRTGCFTCRRRRVKCDEHRPTCTNCDRNSYVCQGPGYTLDQTVEEENSSDYKVKETTRRAEPGPSGRETSSSKHSDSSIVRRDDNSSSGVLNGTLAWTRCDPFNAFCIDSCPEEQRIFDHSVKYQWSLFAPSQQSTELAVVKKDVMGYVISNPVAYHSLLYAGACHQNFWNKSPNRRVEHNTQLLWLKTKSIKAMREAIEQAEGKATDDILIAALMLAVFDTGDKVQRRPYGKVQGRKTLTYKLDAEFYAALDVEWRHLNIFYNLVQARGGILTMRPSALRTSAILFDVFNAYIHLARPRMEALVPLSTTMSMRTWQIGETALYTATMLPQGFDGVFARMTDGLESKALRAIVIGFILVMQDFDHIEGSGSYLYSQINIPEEQQVIWIRSMIIHELLMLPETLESADPASMSVLIYEVVRMSCLMFCQVWLFGDNNMNRRMARKQALMLQPLLKRCIAGASKLCEILPDFYLWVVLLGLMLAYEDFDMTGDNTCLETIAPFVAHSLVITQIQAWPIVKGVVSRFMFPSRDCDVTGREAWEYACEILNRAQCSVVY